MELDKVNPESIKDESQDALLNLHRHLHGLAEQGQTDCLRLRRAHKVVADELKRRELEHRSPLACKGMPGLYLHPQHGFLLWRGKKTAIARSLQFYRDHKDLAGPLIAVSGPEAFGVLELGQPARMTVKEFDRPEFFDRHRVWPEERREWWPDEETLVVYPVVSFEPFEAPQPVVLPRAFKGLWLDAVEFRQYTPPTDRERWVLAQSEKLPKTIVLTPRAVSLTGSTLYGRHTPRDKDVVIVGAEWRPDEEQFVVPLTPTFNEKLSRVFKAVYDSSNGVQYISEGQGATFDHLPLYALALVRLPRLEIEHVSETEPEFAELAYDKDGVGAKARGLYLVEPHGQMIYSGLKKAVVKSRKLALAGPLVLVSGDLAYGMMELGEPRQIDLQRFASLYDEHRISDAEREAWWPDARALWLYPVKSFEKYETPLKVKVPQGVQTVIKDVEFERKEAGEKFNPGQARDEAGRWASGSSFSSPEQELASLRQEVLSHTHSLEDVASGKAPVGVEGRGGRDIREAEQRGMFTAEVNRVPIYARTEENARPLIEYLRGGGKYGTTKFSKLLGYTDSEIETYQKFLDLQEKLSPKSFSLETNLGFKMTKADLDRKLRGAPASVKKQAWQSYQEDEVKPGRPFVPLKPLRPVEPSQRQLFSNFVEYVDSLDAWPVWVSCKRDGVRHTVHRKGDKVYIFSDDGVDNAGKLPELVERFGRIPGGDFVLDCEIEYWKDKQHYPREAAAGAVHSSEGTENLVANVFLAVYWDGKDLHKEDFGTVYKIMEKLPADTFSDKALDPAKGRINVIPHYLTEKRDFEKECMKEAYKPGVEGVVVKLDGRPCYPLDGGPGDPVASVKWHKNCPMKCTVLKATETKTPQVYNYTYGVLAGDTKPTEPFELDGKTYLIIGKTFSTNEKYPIGSEIEIEAETVNLTENDDGTVEVSFWVPNVIKEAEKQGEDWRA